MKFTERIERMKPSATTTIANKARQKKERKEPVISFSTGEPDFNSPAKVIEYAVKAMEEGHTHYTSTSGIKELKEEIINYYQSRFDLSYVHSGIVVATGAKQILYETLGCIVEPGNEVIIITPAWVSYVEQVRLFDGVPTIIDTEKNKFTPSIEDIEKKITENTVAIVINSPNNPSGVIYGSFFLKQLADLAIERDILVINDEVYERLIYGNAEYHHILKVQPYAVDNVININSASKSYAMTGWRIGFAVGPEELVKRITTFQGHLTSNTSSISQWATVGALKESQAEVEKMRKIFERRRNLILKLLDQMPLISYIPPDGAFYVFINIKKCLGLSFRNNTILDDVVFCEVLLDEKNIALVPGSAFLQPGYCRISYSVSGSDIQEGMSRLAEFLSELKDLDT